MLTVLRFGRGFKFKAVSSGNFEDTFQYWILEKFRNDSRFATQPKGYGGENLANEGSFRGKVVSPNRSNILAESLARMDEIISEGMNRFQLFESYCDALKRASDSLARSNRPSPHHVVQTIYYASFLKKSPIARNPIRVALDSLTTESLLKLDHEEIAIFCNGLFRTSTVIPDRLLDHVHNRFSTNLEEFFEKPACFVCIVKTLRHAKRYDYKLLPSVASLMTEPTDSLGFEGKIHTLAYMCDASYSDVNFITRTLLALLDEVRDLICHQRPCRLKDIDRILWTASKYDVEEVKLKLNELKELTDYLIFLAVSKFRNKPESIISSILFLWMLEYKDRADLCNRFLTRNNIAIIKGMSKFKDIAKLYLLLSCVRIEMPNLLDKTLFKERDDKLMPRIDNYLDKRPKLNRVLQLLQRNSQLLCLSDVHCVFKIPDLYIGGISANTKRGPISIEVIDETVCLHKTNVKLGMMNLKLRLLKAQGVPTCITIYVYLHLKKSQKASVPLFLRPFSVILYIMGHVGGGGGFINSVLLFKVKRHQFVW